MIFPAAGPAGARARTRVKICGLTHPADAALAVECGADALGLNFHPGSPRCLDPAGDGDWLRALGGSVYRVGVVVNPTWEALLRLIAEKLVDAVQLHGDEDPAFCARLADHGIPFAKALRVQNAASLRDAANFCTNDLLLDAFQAGTYGGTGHTIDWDLAAGFVAAERARGRRTILSGGLRPENVREAIVQVRPFGVDVASGVECAGNPRRKDPSRLRAFFAAVQTADGLA